MEHTKKLLWVPLGRVMPSRFNERRHAVDPVTEGAGADLGAGIAA